MALRNKFLSPTCAPDLVDIDTYFFSKKIFRSDTRICVTITSFFELFLPPVVQSTRARLIETPPTKHCGSAAVVRRGDRMGGIWGAAPRFGPRSSSRTAILSYFCPEFGRHLPTCDVPTRRPPRFSEKWFTNSQAKSPNFVNKTSGGGADQEGT